MGRLIPNPYADGREWAIKTNILRFTGINTAIYRAEEQIRAIAEANLRARVKKRDTRKPADVGRNNGM